MSRSPSYDRQRVIVYAAIAAILGFLIGFLEQGTLGGGLVLGLVAGVAVPLGLLLINVVSRYIER
jgi:hypothetical protein